MGQDFHVQCLMGERSGEVLDAKGAARIAMFDPRFRAEIAALCERSQRCEDLAESFPALLFALATGFGDPVARARAIEFVHTGTSLRVVAGALGLPLWLRRLPPCAFTEPLRRIPGGEGFSSRVHGYLPAAGLAAQWLSRVLLAYEVCDDEEAALWIARHYKGAGPAATDPGLLYLLAWIWHTKRPDTLPHRLMRRAWQPQLSARRAAEEIEHWRDRLALAMALGDGVKDTWVPEGHCRGFDFVALRTAEDFIAEAARMDNCLDHYAHRLAGRAVRVFSLRKGDRSVANLEIACHELELGMPTIAQLRIARNRRAGMDIWQAAYAWLGSHAIRRADPGLLNGDRTVQQRTSAKIWRPFMDALWEGHRSLFAEAFGTRVSAARRRRAPDTRPAHRPPVPLRPRVRKAGLGAP
jgi:hypothetical protein